MITDIAIKLIAYLLCYIYKFISIAHFNRLSIEILMKVFINYYVFNLIWLFSNNPLIL